MLRILLAVCRKMTWCTVCTSPLQTCCCHMWWLWKWSLYQGWSAQRRFSSNNIGAEVDFNAEMQLTMKKKHSLQIPGTSRSFCTSLAVSWKKAWIELHHSGGDADYDIASTACTMAKRRSVAVVGDDTDLLVLLLHHLRPRHHVIFLQIASKILNIRILQDHLDPNLTASLLFLHAVTECDMTSRPYSIGKVMAMSKCHQLKDHVKSKPWWCQQALPDLSRSPVQM